MKRQCVNKTNVIVFEDGAEWCRFGSEGDGITVDTFFTPSLTPANARDLAAWLLKAADRIEAKAKPSDTQSRTNSRSTAESE